MVLMTRVRSMVRRSAGVMLVSVPWQLLSSRGIEDRPESEAPGSVRRGQPAPEVAEAFVDNEISGTPPSTDRTP